MNSKTIHFVRRGELVSLANVPPTRTLLQVLREDLACVGTKEGCNEGDCGACTVVLGEASSTGGAAVKYSAVNSCIRLAHSIDGMALWTVEDLKGAEGELHPAQKAMVQCHASQCGFCTPGFVMSLFAMYQNRVCRGEVVSRETALQDLSGNLCRCTGYRPILDAAQAMGTLPGVRMDETELLRLLELTKHISRGLEANLTPQTPEKSGSEAYLLPQTLPELLAARARWPQAQIVAGCTDVGLWVNKLHMDFDQVLDVTQVRELKQVETYPNHIAIGAAVNLTQAFAALVHLRPQLHSFAGRFAGLTVRNSGTLGGNVANGSPIGDSMPLLIALGASVVLMRQSKAKTKGKAAHREMPLEALYTGYRKNVMAANEVLAWIKVPKPLPGEIMRMYKISKRFEDDISAVCLGLLLHVEGGVVTSASIGVGGVAATPVRALKTQAALVNQPWTQATVARATATLRAEFSPISDLRASSAYRSQVLGNLLQRFWLESQGQRQINLEHIDVNAVFTDTPTGAPA